MDKLSIGQMENLANLTLITGFIEVCPVRGLLSFCFTAHFHERDLFLKILLEIIQEQLSVMVIQPMAKMKGLPSLIAVSM